jgi:hypothetical protein
MPADLADLVAVWAVGLARNEPAPDLSILAAVDVAWLIELTIQAVRAKDTRKDQEELDGHLDSHLAGVIVDLVRQTDLDAEVAGAEK